MNRKSFIRGLSGVAAGMPLGAFAYRSYRNHFPEQGFRTYSQSGEDRVVEYTFIYLKLYNKQITYLDIGAHDPIIINNTYLFYMNGCRGVLVEPNPEMCRKLRAIRPGDTTLVAGIGVSAVSQADYYVMSESSWNTFSKEEAEHQVKATNGQVSINYVMKMPLLDVNEVIAKHFKGAPSFISVDAEGLHLAILKAIDYQRFRPKIICVETLVSGSNDSISEIPEFMVTKGYVARGGSFVNTIFVDSEIL
jgi:FkbM family methyltransferase